MHKMNNNIDYDKILNLVTKSMYKYNIQSNERLYSYIDIEVPKMAFKLIDKENKSLINYIEINENILTYLIYYEVTVEYRVMAKIIYDLLKGVLVIENNKIKSNRNNNKNKLKFID